MRLAAALALAAILAAPAAGKAAPADRARVFDLPALSRALVSVRGVMAAGRAEAALEAFEGLAARFPELGALALGAAEAAAAAGRGGRARALLARALERGVTPSRIMRSPPLAALAEDPLLAARLSRARARPRPPERPAYLAPASPGPVRDGVALVRAANTEWAAAQGRLRVRLAPPGADRAARPAAGPGLPAATGRRLAGLVASGRAAGNAGDLYDNHDRDHSTLAPDLLPQLTFVEYGPAARDRRIDHGAVTGIGFDRPVFGNSSTAITGGPFWRSQARELLTRPGGPAELFAQYASNQLYVYPEHRDHDPARGDVFPANTPYQLVSQGSSGSDRALLQAVGVILAALPPAAKARARDEGLIAPLVQAVFRQGYAPGGYLTGAAHPSAFDGDRIDLDRLIDIAQRQSAQTLPPMVRLSVMRETPPEAGRTRFSGGLSERVFDTPSAIARVHRRTDREMTITLSAAATRDPNGRPLRFAWRILRGDAARIGIAPSADGRVATVTIPWHAPHPVPGDPARRTHRVDIGIFAHNGAAWSAPAFLSVAHPPLERRRYGEDGRVLEIAYPGLSAEGYADPRLFPRQGWTDRYRYGPGGALRGWTRVRNGARVSYTPQGLRRTGDDRAGTGQPVRYGLARGARGLLRVTVTPAAPSPPGQGR